MRNLQFPKSHTIVRFIKTLLAALAILAMSYVALAGGITVGHRDNGNCCPFMCNGAGTSSGLSIDYQQVFCLHRVPWLNHDQFSYFFLLRPTGSKRHAARWRL